MASISKAKAALMDFVLGPTGESLVLIGRWGTGKTYTWKRVLYEARQRKELPAYSYVSLFGLSDIQTVRKTIFLNAFAQPPSSATDLARGARYGADKRLKKVFAAVAGAVPYLKNADITTIMGWFVRGNLICFDDVERRNPSLKLTDLMGLVSFLKEECDCQVAVITNDEAFTGETADFRRYFEKVFDRAVVFQPTPEEAAAIAIVGDDRAREALRTFSTKLGLTNIRLLKKLERFAVEIDQTLVGSANEVVDDVIRSLSVIGWSVFEPLNAPPIEFLDENRPERALRMLGGESEPETAQETRWREQLRDVGFSGFGPVEHLVRDFLEKGLLDVVALKAACIDADDRAARRILEAPFFGLLMQFELSWDGDAEEFAERLIASVDMAGTALHFNNVDLAVKMLEGMDRPSEARELALRYLRKVDPAHPLLFWENNKLGDTFRELVIAHRREPELAQSLAEALRFIADDAHHVPQLHRLALASPEEVADALRSCGTKLEKLYSEVERQIVAPAALGSLLAGMQALANASDLNAFRLKRFLSRPAPQSVLGEEP